MTVFPATGSFELPAATLQSHATPGGTVYLGGARACATVDTAVSPAGSSLSGSSVVSPRGVGGGAQGLQELLPQLLFNGMLLRESH